VLINNAKELLEYSKGEESFAEKLVKSIADMGFTLVIAGGSLSEIMMHFFE